MPRVLAASDEPASNGVGLAYLVLSNEGSGKPLRSLMHELNTSQVSEVLSQLIDVNTALSHIHLPAFGSLTTFVGTRTAAPPAHDLATDDDEVTVAPLAGRGGCSELGPFARYGDYAAALVEQFIPQLQPWIAEKFASRLRCWGTAVRLADVADSNLTKPAPTLIHGDLNPGNILVSVASGHARITTMLDWELALSAHAGDESNLSLKPFNLTHAQRQVLGRLWKRAGLPRRGADSVYRNNSRLYKSTYTMVLSTHKMVHRSSLASLNHPYYKLASLEAAHDIDELLRSRSC